MWEPKSDYLWVNQSGHGDWWIFNATPLMCTAIFPWVKTASRCVCETEFVPDFLSSSSPLFALLSSLWAGRRELWCGTLSVLWPQAQEEPDALWTGLWWKGIYINKKIKKERQDGCWLRGVHKHVQAQKDNRKPGTTENKLQDKKCVIDVLYETYNLYLYYQNLVL